MIDKVCFCFMTVFGSMLPGWHCRSSLTWDMRFCHINHILLIAHEPNHNFSFFFFFFFKHLVAFLCQKTKSCIQRFFGINLEFCHTGINNFVNWWHKCIDVQGSYFGWLKHCSNLFIQGYSKIGHFQNSLIYITPLLFA